MAYKKYKYGGHSVPGMYQEGGVFGNSMGGGRPIRRQDGGKSTPPPAGRPQVNQPNFPFDPSKMTQKQMTNTERKLMMDSIMMKKKAMMLKQRQDSLMNAKKEMVLNHSPMDLIKALDSIQDKNKMLKDTTKLLAVKMKKMAIINSLNNKTMIQKQQDGDSKPSPKKHGGSHKKRKK
jgi:hypothetical protein